MHSHTGCICLSFLHCVFSNVSSNCLLEWMQSHIGCIYMIFLQCVFSNVSSKRLHAKMYSHTGYTLSYLWRFPHLLCSNHDFQKFLPFLFFTLDCASPNGYFLLRQISGSRIYKISVEKGKWNVIKTNKMSWIWNALFGWYFFQSHFLWRKNN